jgi:hypothetical protein
VSMHFLDEKLTEDQKVDPGLFEKTITQFTILCFELTSTLMTYSP